MSHTGYALAGASALAFLATFTTTVTLAAAPREISIPGQRIFPESLTSAPDGTIYIGSAGARTIFRVKPGETTADVWVAPSADAPAGFLGVFADAASNTLWACALPARSPGSTPGPSTLRAYDLKSGAAKEHYPISAAGGVCNDIAVDGKGNVYATDSSNMEIVRLAKRGATLEVWAGGGSFGPKGGVLDGISVLGNRVLVNALNTSKLFSVPIASDGKAGPATEVKLDRPIDKPDGMRSFGKNGLLVVEGGSGGRLSRVSLKGDTGKAVTLKEGFPDGPVAITVVGKTAYVLEGQLTAMRSDPDAQTRPFHATAVEVGKP